MSGWYEEAPVCGLRDMYRFSLSENEKILKKDAATLHIDREALSGALYLTSGRLVFVGYEAGVAYKTEKAVSLDRIAEVRAGKTMFLIPNVLDITTRDNERLKIIVLGRDEWLAAIQQKLEHKQPFTDNTTQVNL
jgi:hypothetical protein